MSQEWQTGRDLLIARWSAGKSGKARSRHRFLPLHNPAQPRRRPSGVRPASALLPSGGAGMIIGDARRAGTQRSCVRRRVKVSGSAKTPPSCGLVVSASLKLKIRVAPMERFQYEILGWIELSGQMAVDASVWYRGAGWYMNGRDTSGEITSCRLVAPASTSARRGAGGSQRVRLGGLGGGGICE